MIPFAVIARCSEAGGIAVEEGLPAGIICHDVTYHRD